ncbi:MAG: 5'/3'-nucleotidase SurE [Anaerolineaceae bacterium]|nr:5'/3'-nucleotidase SurE [Anaerolineaceae bacterium]
MKNTKPQILLTNDDGIQSPGLWAAAEELSKLGYVTIAAPREQSSGTGRSLPVTSDGVITATRLKIGGQEWTTYAIGGTPAQAVLHAVMEIMPEPPALVVSGINYGENVGHSITISGTVGAALEGAAFGIPSMAISLQIPEGVSHMSYSREVDFSPAAFFTKKFAAMLLERHLPEDVDVLKIDVPGNATPETSWRITRLARHRYYSPELCRTGAWDEPGGYIGGYLGANREEISPDSDAYTLAYDRMVAVTPLSLDLTSRVNLQELETELRAKLG